MATSGILSDYCERKWLDLVLSGTAFAQPDIYLALFTADPGEAGSLANEVSGTGYNRIACANWSAPSGRAIGNSDTVIFPTAGAGGWNTVTHVGIMDGATPGAGNLLARIQITVAKTVAAGETPQFAATQIAISVPTGNGLPTTMANALLNHVFRKAAGGTAYSAPGTKKIALCSASPGDAGTITSPSGNAYAHTTQNTWIAAATDGSNITRIKNDGACVFPTATPAGWGPLTYGAAVDGSNVCLFYGPLTTPITVAAGDTPTWANQAFVIRLN